MSPSFLLIMFMIFPELFADVKMLIFLETLANVIDVKLYLSVYLFIIYLYIYSLAISKTASTRT